MNGARGGLTDGLRDFIKVDNHIALEAGHLREGVEDRRLQKGTKKCLSGESPNELTLRAEEEGTWKSCINVDHIVKERWGPPLVDADWHAFCQALHQGIAGEDWKQLHDSYKAMSRAVVIMKPQKAQKAKALWKMKAAKKREKSNMIRSVKTTSW